VGDIANGYLLKVPDRFAVILVLVLNEEVDQNVYRERNFHDGVDPIPILNRVFRRCSISHHSCIAWEAETGPERRNDCRKESKPRQVHIIEYLEQSVVGFYDQTVKCARLVLLYVLVAGLLKRRID